MGALPVAEEGPAGALPPGWEKKASLKYAGRYYYTNGFETRWT